MVTIAVDAMGGDFGLAVTVPAAKIFLERHSNAKLVMVGDKKQLSEAFKKEQVMMDRVVICHASEVVGMDELPQLALKNKKDSSMRIMTNQVEQGVADAAVSAGNTGALMATARFILKTLPGISRPAIAKFLPTKTGQMVCVLDLGANVDCSAEQLLQFASLGSHLVSALYPHKKTPKIGLLNVGSEDIKGTATVKQAYELMKQSILNFYGNVEGSDIFEGKVDVVVCDGFVGNIVLKTIEGSVHFIADVLRQEFKDSWYSKLMALCSLPILKKFKTRLDPRRFNGAIFLGLRGIVVKSHGGTDIDGFVYALEDAYAEVQGNVLAHLKESVQQTTLQQDN